MSIKNDPELLAYAQSGYRGLAFDGLETSSVWYAWKAGIALHESGRTEPLKCSASRGSSVRIETAGGTEFKIHFDRKTDELDQIERVNA